MILTTCKHFDLVGNRCNRVTDGKCDDLPDCEFKYIEELKTEIERLKALCDTYKTCYQAKHNYIDGKLFKYCQTLQEIKAIADARCNECKYGKDGITCKFGDCGEAKLHLITQLITKAEK